MAQSCPQCSRPLTTECFHGVEIGICANCVGLWFAKDQLHKLIVSDPISIDSLDDHVLKRIGGRTHTIVPTAGTLHCPTCALPLVGQRYEYNSPIHMNSCPNCGGFWILEHELHGLQNWIDQDHQPLMAEESVKLEFAKAAIEHDAEMYRQERLRQFLSVLQQRIFWAGG